MQPYIARMTDPLLERMIAEHAAVWITGPRACGKTTSALRRAAGVVRLDVPAQAAAFSADPDAALAAVRDTPVLLDEWQEVPELLGAVKRSVDADPRPGRYILSGSVRAPLEGGVWPGTGRVVSLPMTTLTQRERRGTTASPAFLATLSEARTPTLPQHAPNLIEYVAMALEGGFPQAVLGTGEAARRRWLAAYSEHLLGRDLAGLGARADVPRLRAYLRAYALVSGAVSDHAAIFRAAGIDRRTAERYESLLEALFVVEALPAWAPGRLARLVRQPKRVIADPGLWGAIIGVGTADVIADGVLLGRLLETFVIAQLRAELAALPGVVLHHLRTEGGRREVDLVAEIGAGRVLALEVKATAAPNVSDARHLTWLRDALGDRFVAGAVLHTGPAAFTLGDRLLALPICTLWG